MKREISNTTNTSSSRVIVNPSQQSHITSTESEALEDPAFATAVAPGGRSPSPSIADDDRPSSANSSTCPLPESFQPGDDDVICGRGKKCYNHIGNARFRQLVMQTLDDYSRAKSKLDKSNVLSRVVDQIRQISPSGGFVKQDARTGRWVEVGDFLAREKTSQAFRDALHDRYKSSNLSKKKRRQEEQAKASDVYGRIARSEYEAKRIDRLAQDLVEQQREIAGFDRLTESHYGSRSQMLPFHDTYMSSGRNSFMKSIGATGQESRGGQRSSFQGNRMFLTGNTASYAPSGSLLHPGRPRYISQGGQFFHDPLFGSASGGTNQMPQLMNDGTTRGTQYSSGTPFFRNPVQRVQHVTNRTSLEDFERMHQSMPEIGARDTGVNYEPYLEHDSFHNSMPNLHSRNQPRQNSQPTMAHQDKIEVNLSASMHQDIRAMEIGKSFGNSDLDPIPLDQFKISSNNDRKISSKAAVKKSLLGDMNISSSSGESSGSSRIGKVFMACLGKMNENTITDDNPYEPIPISPHAQNFRHQQQQIQQQHETEDDRLEFGEG